MEQLLQAEKLTCHHCGDPCDEEITDGENYYCCYGCKAVNELLVNADLEDHFSTVTLSNKSFSEIGAEKKYAFLDNQNIEKQLLHFNEGDFSVIKFHLPGIHCSSCIYLLEHLPKLDHQIIKAEVNFTKQLATITYNNQTRKLKEVAVLLSQLGYPPDISLDSLDKTKKQISKSNLGAKIAVAGFCFGNAMLMSMPEYLDQNFGLTENFKQTFGYINLVLSLPVLFFSAADYFQKAWKGIKIKTINIDVPIVLGLLTLTIRSYFEIISATGAGYIDSLTGLIFFLLIGKWYQGKTYKALSFERDYSSYFPVSVTCIIDDLEVLRPLKELKKGDIIVLHNDELIPADGKIIGGTGSIDYSFVTGESNLIEKQIGHKVFAGGRQKGSQLFVEIEKGVSSSELTQLWNTDTFTKKEENLQNLVDKLSRYFTLTIIILALSTGIFWGVVNPVKIWDSVTAVLIVACPCALALVLPFAYGHGMRLLGRNGLYLKNAEIIERLAKIQNIIFDKTGTLTESGSKVEFIGNELSSDDLRIIKSGVGNSAHPLSRIIHNHLDSVEKLPITSFEEITGQGFQAEINSKNLKIGSSDYLEIQEKMENNQSRVHVFLDGYQGYFKIEARYRAGIFQMLNKLSERFHLALLSGDNDGEKEKLATYFNQLSFNQKPQDKLDYLANNDSNHLMVGDGLNDAGALKKASVGIAVAEDIHQFSPACDAILNASSINHLDKILKFSRDVRMIIFVAFGLSFSYNLVGLSFAISGQLTPLISAILMPLSSVTVVGFITFLIVQKSKFFNRKS